MLVGQARTREIQSKMGLQSAACSGNKEIVQVLLDKGADVNAEGGKYGNALQAAAANGHKETVKKLLSQNASPKIESRAIDGSSLLHAAVASGNREILTALLDAGAKVHISAENTSKQTPLHLAVISGDLQIVELLHPHVTPSDCNIQDVDGRTRLHLAVDKQAFDITKQLLESGASANAKDFAEVSPFQLAFQAKKSQIPLLFLKMAKDLPAKKASDWRSVLPGSPDGIIMLTSGELAMNIVSKGELKEIR